MSTHHIARAALSFVFLLVSACLCDAQTYTRWLLAEGAANTFFEEEILIANPNAATAQVRITFLLPTAPPITDTFTMAASSRKTVRVNQVAGLAGVGAVSAVVECLNGLDLAVERSMYWAGGARTSGHNSPGVLSPATEWLLAEGATGFFNTFVLIANPDPGQAAALSVTFLKSDGTTVARTYTVGPNSRHNIWVNAEIPELANQPFSTIVRSTNGVGVVVERAMYFGPGYKGGHESAGVTQPSPTWYFAEGFTGPAAPATLSFDTFLLLANPGSSPVSATVTFFREVGGPLSRTYTLLPTSRENIWVDLLPGLEAHAFSIQVAATAPIVAERAMYWGAATWHEAHETPGVTAPALRWAFAEGVEDVVETNGPSHDTYFLVANATTSTLNLRATFLREDGTGIVTNHSVAPQSRFTLPTSLYPALSHQRFAAFLETTNGVPFVAERAVYWGPNYLGGHASTGTAWTSPIATPPAPPAPTISSVSPAIGSVFGGTEVVITGTNLSVGATATIGGAAASNVVVLNSTTLRATTSARSAGAADVVVTSGGTTLTLSGAFTYAAPPTVTAISPSVGSTAGGTLISIQGAFFAPGAMVRVGGSPATDIAVPNANTITARTPAHAAGLVEVTVTAGGLTTTLANAFTYLPPVPATSAVTTVSFGDSITFGVTSTIVSMGSVNMVASTTTTGYPQRLQALLAGRYSSQPISVINSGAPGECISAVCPPNTLSGQNRLPSALAGQPNLVILLEGVNDTNAVVADDTLSADVQRVAARLRSMVQTAKQGGRSVILSTLLPAAPDALLGEPRASLTRIRALNTEIRSIAAQEAVVLVDMYAAFGGDNVNAAWLSPDGLHPSDAGYQHMAQVFYDAIRTRFEVFSGS